jgi:putative flippase GtrA
MTSGLWNAIEYLNTAAMRSTNRIGPSRRDIAGELMRFGVATGLSAMVSLGMPIALHELFHVDQKVAVAISQVSVLAINFVTIKMFVFRSRGNVRADMFRYMGSALVFRGIEYASFLLLFEVAGIFYVTALVLTLGTSTLIKFVWYRFIFGERSLPVG